MYIRLSPTIARPMVRYSKVMVEGGGDFAEELLASGPEDLAAGEKQSRGINRIGKPTDPRNVAIHMVFPPLSKYSLPKIVPAVLPAMTKVV